MCSVFNSGGYIGKSVAYGGYSVVSDGLTLSLDAGDTSSYPGTGSTWFDTSGNGYDFTINPSAFSTAGGIPHMNFEGSHGAAKRIVGGALTDVPNFSNATIMLFSTILNSTATWRTLIRGAGADHQVMIQSGAINLGMYDNNGGNYIDSGFNINDLPNPYTQFNCLTFKLSQTSPYYEFRYNNNSQIYTITNANATFNNGYSVIGAYHNVSTDVNNNTQYWGKISVFLYYNKLLSNNEIQQNYRALKGRFGL